MRTSDRRPSVSTAYRPAPYREWVRLCVARGLRATDDAPAADDPVRSLLTGLCARADLEALSLLLPAYMGGLGAPEDEERLTTALRMLHAEKRLPAPEQSSLSEAIALRSA
ncbi:hypothetical protein ACIRQP_23120 [Streptomyces sp. NPDC102274]|uniref:hypothetical protein n=1 Tax=Streptomyces sp. NPDC102274 TaxID=3366151 RepID=UPI00382E9547